MQQRRARARTVVASLALALALPLVAGCAGEQRPALADPPSVAASSSADDVSPDQSATSSRASGPSSGAAHPPSQPSAAQAGAYISLADYSADPARYHASSAVVLFFHADWCHYCRETDDDIAAHGLPDGLTLVQVDYDSESSLREAYGVTVQHTYVQIDADGEPVARFAGQTSGAEILAETR